MSRVVIALPNERRDLAEILIWSSRASNGSGGATAEERPIGEALPREMLVEASSWLAPVEMAMLSIASKQWVHIVMEAAQVWARRHGLNLPIVRNCCVNDNWCHEASEPFYPEDATLRVVWGAVQVVRCA